MTNRELGDESLSPLSTAAKYSAREAIHSIVTILSFDSNGRAVTFRKNMNSYKRALAFSCCLSCAHILFSIVDQASITGTVTDASGGIV